MCSCIKRKDEVVGGVKERGKRGLVYEVRALRGWEKRPLRAGVEALAVGRKRVTTRSDIG